MRVLGVWFGIGAVLVLIPLQLEPGVALARLPNRVRADARLNLVAFALVMMAAGLHGWAIYAGR